jgi:hypothetical protein
MCISLVNLQSVLPSVARSPEAFTATSAQNDGHFCPLHGHFSPFLKIPCEFILLHQNTAHVLFDQNLKKNRSKILFLSSFM